MRCVRPASSCFLTEVFAPHTGVQDGRAEADRVRAAAAALEADGARVRFLYSVFVPAEETSFHLLAADRRATVERALKDAGLEADRISPALVVAGTTSGEAPASATRSSRRSLSRR